MFSLVVEQSSSAAAASSSVHSSQPAPWSVSELSQLSSPWPSSPLAGYPHQTSIAAKPSSSFLSSSSPLDDSSAESSSSSYAMIYVYLWLSTFRKKTQSITMSFVGGLIAWVQNVMVYKRSLWRTKVIYLPAYNICIYRKNIITWSN